MNVRTIALLILFSVGGTVKGQGNDDPNLTSEFSKLSAKERTRLARKEQEEAANDPAYQAIMAQAEAHFQARQYEQALAGYQEGRRLRPINVYPKVKIRDVKALIAMEAARVAKEPLPIAVEDTISTVDPVVVDPHPLLVEPDRPAPSITPSTKQITSTTTPGRPSPTTTSPGAISVAPTPAADGMTERRYQEGNAQVIERCLVLDGKTVVYKRVAHRWGQVFHFEDGQAIDPRVWKARFPALDP